MKQIDTSKQNKILYSHRVYYTASNVCWLMLLIRSENLETKYMMLSLSSRLEWSWREHLCMLIHWCLDTRRLQGNYYQSGPHTCSQDWCLQAQWRWSLPSLRPLWPKTTFDKHCLQNTPRMVCWYSLHRKTCSVWVQNMCRDVAGLPDPRSPLHWSRFEIQTGHPNFIFLK